MKRLIIVMIGLSALSGCSAPAYAAALSYPQYTDTQIVNAIFYAENSKAHPYGIMQKYKHTTPRQACFNTVAHARKNWDGKKDFIKFLGSRYAPIGAKNDPHGLNKNWVGNVHAILERR